MAVRKAVVPAAGLGTRTLPASKAVPKELLPVVDKPVIQYTVEEIARARIREVCIVISRGKEAIADHFGPNSELESALEERGKVALLDEIRAIQRLAEISYAKQDEPLGLGHAVLCARDQVGEEPFAVALPDEIYDPGENLLGEMVASFEQDGTSVIAVTEVPHEEIGLYGSIDPEGDGEFLRVRSVVEKPEPSEAPSNLAVIGRYVLEPRIFDVLEDLGPGTGGEIQLTDGLEVLAREGRLSARVYRGRRWDVGKKDSYLEAVVALAAERPDLGEDFRGFLDRFRP
ncbi:MAG: UTP--glucose-1-phosphate uridylyltransferase [Actinomycetota bacterium]